MTALPSGWAWTNLAQLTTTKSGDSKLIKGKLSSTYSQDTPYQAFSASGNDVWRGSYSYEGDAVIVSAVGARCGKAFPAKGRWSAIANTHIVWPVQDAINSRLLWYRINDESYWVKGGSAQPFVKVTATFEKPFALPPLTEQQRIADKLDTVLARVDAVNDRLARVAPLLKRFRQSVLAAATSGRLTADWRDGNSEASAWPLVDLGSIATDFSYGSAAKSAKTGAVPVLRMGNIQDGQLDWSDLVFTSDPTEINKYTLRKGDVLFNRTNSPELVGKTAVYKGEREAIYAGYLIRIRCADHLLPDFLSFCLGSPKGREYCWSVKSDGVSQSNINAKKLAAFNFELPPLGEQTEIVRRVDLLFAFADRLEARLQAAQTAASRLTPALLAKAFRGELVPQDPNDEPATELLRRLAANREATSQTPRARKPRKPV